MNFGIGVGRREIQGRTEELAFVVRLDFIPVNIVALVQREGGGKFRRRRNVILVGEENVESYKGGGRIMHL